MRTHISIGFLVAASLVPAVGLADTVKFCFSTAGTYNDNGFTNPNGSTEDRWGTDVAKPSRAAWGNVYKSNSLIWADYLDDGNGADGAGCTPTLTVTGVNDDYDFYVNSYGSASNDIDVRDTSLNLYQAILTNYVVSGGSGTYNVTITVTSNTTAYRVFNIYNAAGMAIATRTSLSGQTFFFQADYGGAGGSHYTDPTVFITSTHGMFKYVILHEMGHRVGDLNTQGSLVGSDYTASEGDCPSSDTVHSMLSREYSKAACNEGYAHFYSANIWNFISDTDCHFEYYKPINGDNSPSIDCESGHTGFEVDFYDTNCTVVAGRSVEMDWLREYWDVQTNATPPSFSEVNDWLDDATPWTDTTAYTELDSKANTEGGNLNTNWDNTKAANGVDH